MKPDYMQKMELQDFRAKYSNNHGFVFIVNSYVKNKSIESLVENMKTFGITKENPLCVSRVGNAILFAYKDFDGPLFFQVADRFNFMNLARVEPLHLFLKQH